MSLINDYTTSIIAAQRQRDFAAEANERHLAKLAQAGRRPWWRRLFDRPGGPLLPATQVAQPRPTMQPAVHTVSRLG